MKFRTHHWILIWSWWSSSCLQPHFLCDRYITFVYCQVPLMRFCSEYFAYISYLSCVCYMSYPFTSHDLNIPRTDEEYRLWSLIMNCFSYICYFLIHRPTAPWLVLKVDQRALFVCVQVLYLVDEGCHLLDTYSPFPGKESLEDSMLSCLDLLDRALAHQQNFFSFLSNSGCPLLLTGLSKLLLGVNPRSGKPDHLLNVAK